MGKLFVIDGLDGCGKSTQLKLTTEYLMNSGHNVKSVSFPNYDSPACSPVKMYLDGKFGGVNDVNAYTASAFYAVDRIASFKENWQDFYLGGGTVICGRYVSSNIIHQCSKMPESEWESFAEWLFDFEHNKLGLPKPDKVIYLSIDEKSANKLLLKRYNGEEEKKDIHEVDREYQKKCAKVSLWGAEKFGWNIVEVGKNGEIYTREEINKKIINIING